MFSPTRLFLWMGLVFGTIYVFLIPPFQAPDEVHHFYRAYHLSEGNWMGEKTADQRFGGELPQSLSTLSGQFRYLRYAPEKITSWKTIKEAAAISLASEQTIFLDFPNVAYYAPMPYVPQALVLKIGSLFEIPPLYLLYLTRLATLFIWLTIVYFALRILPFHQHTIAFLALLPASLVFHAGINADAVTNAFCFWLMAYLLHLIFVENQLQKWHFILLLVSAIITINKVVYAPIFLLAWLIPTRKWGSKKRFWFGNISLLFFHVGLLLFWYQIAGNLFITYDHYHPDFRIDKQLNPGVDPMAQLTFILEEPFNFAAIFFHSYTEIFPYTMIHYVGKFGWEGNYLPIWLLAILLLTCILLPLLEKPVPIRFNWQKRFSFLAIGFIMLIAFSIVIYMQWNAPRDPQITALSGRYFIPIFPFFLLCLANQKWKVPKKWWQISYVLVLLIGQFGLMYAIIARYYGWF